MAAAGNHPRTLRSFGDDLKNVANELDENGER
jgi:hypothetical protein